MWKFVLIALFAVILPMSMAVADEQSGESECAVTEASGESGEAFANEKTSCRVSCGKFVKTSCEIECDDPVKRAKCYCDDRGWAGTWDVCVCE